MALQVAACKAHARITKQMNILEDHNRQKVEVKAFAAQRRAHHLALFGHTPTSTATTTPVHSSALVDVLFTATVQLLILNFGGVLGDILQPPKPSTSYICPRLHHLMPPCLCTLCNSDVMLAFRTGQRGVCLDSLLPLSSQPCCGGGATCRVFRHPLASAAIEATVNTCDVSLYGKACCFQKQFCLYWRGRQKWQ